MTKFMCEFCEKWFGERRSLRRHWDSVHNKQEIKCDKCLREFARNDNLMKHQRSGNCGGGGGGVKRKLVEEEGGQGKVGKKVCLSGAGGSKSGGEWRCESCSLNFLEKRQLVLHNNRQHRAKDLSPMDFSQGVNNQQTGGRVAIVPLNNIDQLDLAGREFQTSHQEGYLPL